MDTKVTGNVRGEIQKWAMRANFSSKDRLKTQGFELLRDIQPKLNLKEPTVQKAMELLHQIEESGQLKGKSCNAKVATAVFVASRQTNNPKSIKNIIEVTNAQTKDISNCYNKIK